MTSPPDLGQSKRRCLGDLIDRWCRVESGRTNGELARLLDVHPTTLSRWRSGERAVPDQILAWIADSLDLRLRLDSRFGWSIEGGQP